LKPQFWNFITSNPHDILVHSFHNNEVWNVIFKYVPLAWKKIAWIYHKLTIKSCTW
jgi:hypothetical protein